MRIENYAFGSITIDGKIYTGDVIIFPDRVFSPWWRKEGHLLHREDLDQILKEKPGILVIGQGKFGAMSVPGELIENLKAEGIEVIVARTGKAVDIHNQLESGRVTTALHLTC